MTGLVIAVLAAYGAACADGGGAARKPSSAAQAAPKSVRSVKPVKSPKTKETALSKGFSGSSTDPSWGAPVAEDDFGEPRLDPAKWVVYNAPDDRANPRTPAAVTLRGGLLRLTGGLYGGKDLSGGVASTLLQRYGRWEVRLRAARGAGYSAVALLWPQHMGDPEYAEIDFAEIIDPTRQTAGIFVHHGPADRQAQRLARADFTRWHVVAVDWLPGHLTFWLDGHVVWTYRGPLVPHADRMGLALQNDQICARGRAFCRNRSTPAWVEMDVDWVRVYRA